MDPLSITAAVATLLGCCITVGTSLRKFLIGASEASTLITAMMADLRALRSVLESMEITFEKMNSDKPETGHIGAHWTNLFQSLEDGQQSLAGLQSVLEDANKDVKLLDGVRKQIRVKAVADKIVTCRQEIQAYKDAIHLSLQTVILWNAHSIKGTTDELMATSRTTHNDLQQLATNVEIKLTALQSLFEQSNEAGGMAKIRNLKGTITSAATVISGDGSDVANAKDIDDLMSNFGDWFKSGASQNTLDWIYSDRRQEPLFMLDRLSPPVSEGSFSHTAARTLPVHTQLSSRSDLTSSMGTSNGLLHDANYQRTDLDPPKVDTQLESNPKVQVPIVNVSKPPAKPQRRRLSWFWSSKSSSSLKIRSPMMDERESRSVVKSKQKLPRRLKIVFVGDGAAGKTCLLIMITKGSFPQVYVPTVFESYVADYELNKQDFEVHFFDTAGQEDYDRLRPLSYPYSDAVVITFAIDSPDSLDNAEKKWSNEVSYFCSAAPKFLVGCKQDLRYDPKSIEWLRKSSQTPVTVEQAEDVRKKIGAVAYLETSAKTGEGVFQALNTILSQTIDYQIDRTKQKRDQKHFRQSSSKGAR